MPSVDSPLGQWTHHEHRAPHLDGVLDHVWHFDGHMIMPRERTFPGGYIEIILHLGPLFRDVQSNGEHGELYPEACVTGPQTRAQVIEAPDERCCVMGVRLTPLGAYRVLATPLHHATNATIDLADIVDRRAGELAARCRDAPTVTERFARVIAWIEQRLTIAPDVHIGIEHAAASLARHHGRVRIQALRERTGLTRSRFVSLFREQTGLAPKQFARVLRFRHALTALQRGAPISGAAFDSGYYDQSHLHADFCEFAGMTPHAFVSAQRYPNSPSVPELA